MANPFPAAPAWRQFPFFDIVPIKDVNDLANSPEIFKNPHEISTVISSTIGVLVADINGNVYILNKEFEPIRTWIAHPGGRVTHMVEKKGILVTLGEEDTVKHPLLKIWSLENSDKTTDSPRLLRSIKISLTTRPHPVSIVVLSAALSYLAVALADGTVLLYRHLDQSIFSGSASLAALPKPRIIHEASTEPVTGLGFKEPSDDSPNAYLFIVTINNVLSYQASGRGSGGTPTVVDQVGCGLGNATMDWRAKEMVVARDEAIYMCSTDGRGACYAYEGSKSSVHSHLNYLVIISPPFLPSATAPFATVRNYVAKSIQPASEDITKIAIFDIENKFVAYSAVFTEGVKEVISQWDKIYVVFDNGKLSELQEKPTPEKLDMLYRRALYPLALNLAKTQNLDESGIADIHRQYGDHLYSKAEYDGAMQQFVKTIGSVQPSYVIRKFLDAQRIHNLVTYLQELHSMGLANSDHTTLLLNTYTKLKDDSRLESFIKTESKRSGTINGEDEKEELPFDLETAIRVCRQAGYFKQASYLAKKYERHEDYLRIQIEDVGDYKDALVYLRRLGPETAETNLARYGRAMLESLPQETTQLLIDICTSNSLLSIEDTEDNSSSVVRQSNTAPSYLSYLALNRAATSDSAGVQSSASTATLKADKRASFRDLGQTDSGSSTPPPVQTTTVIKSREPIKRPSPRVYFAHFVDHMDHFVTFLETVAIRRWGQSVDGTLPQCPTEEDTLPVDEAVEKRDQAAVWNTLLELYLSTSTKTPEEEKKIKNKALRLLQSENIPYEPTHALIICSTREFTPGLVLLWEKLGMHEDVLRFWMDKEREGGPLAGEASTQVVHYLELYGSKLPSLYPLVLRFLTSTPELLSRHSEDVEDIVGVIDKEKIMPPLAIVQVLSRNRVASVGLVKQWLMKKIREAKDDIDTDKQLTISYRLETTTKLKQVEDLSDPEHPRLINITQCSTCGSRLDLPSVHFMCNHSYHQRCLAEHENECPTCVRSHAVIREIRTNNARLADKHELFLSEVKENGFEAVSSAFGRGALNR